MVALDLSAADPDGLEPLAALARAETRDPGGDPAAAPASDAAAAPSDASDAAAAAERWLLCLGGDNRCAAPAARRTASCGRAFGGMRSISCLLVMYRHRCKLLHEAPRGTWGVQQHAGLSLGRVRKRAEL